jgi:SAM-dependent methyltransferase
MYRERAVAVQSYLRSQVIRKLQIGTQENILPGWLNTDLLPVDGRVVFLDARERFPFDDSTLDYIFCEHCIEHITYTEGLSALRECYRVLKPGGRVRIATPNLNNIIGLCASPRSEMQERYIEWYIDSFTPQFASYAPGFVVNNCFRLWGHQFIYDPDTLGLAMRTAGFSELRWFAPGESKDENLRGIEGHGRRVGDNINRSETMIAEATRPHTDLSRTI